MTIHQPHDHLFKRVFGIPREVASFLKAWLPAPLRRSLRWSTLKRHPSSFIDSALHGTASDLLFEIARAAPGAGQARLWLYLLFEHQSSPDHWLRLRLLGYCCRIWERDLQIEGGARYLRPIVPLVFYQGKSGWRPSSNFADLYPAAARDWPWLPRFEHLLFDQTRVSPAQAAGRVRARLLQLAMMHAYDHAAPEARKLMKPLLDALEREGGAGPDDMRMFVRYILETGPDDTPEAMGEILSRTAAGGEMRTSGERLRQEGRQAGRNEMLAIVEQRHREGRSEGQREGRLEGQREGRLEGKREGQMETIDGLLRTGVGWSVIERATGIDEEEYGKLKSEPNNGGSTDRDGHGRD